MTQSLRLRLLAGTGLSTAAVLGLLGGSIYFAAARVLQREFDDGLRVEARALAATAEQNRRGVKFDFDPRQMPQFAPSKRAEYFEAWFVEDGLMSRSESLGAGELPHPRSTSTPQFIAITLPDGRAGRSISLQFAPRLDQDGEARADSLPAAREIVVTVARETEAIDRTLSRLRWLLVTLGGAALVLSGAALVVIVSRAVRPVNELARQIETLRETDLDRRLSLEGVPAELLPVADRLNGLLDRLNEAFSRERGFTADAAHELRTPLAGLRTTLDVCRSRPRDPASYEAAIDRCRRIIEGMQDMVQSLLLLARADAGLLAVEKQPLDLSCLLEECWAAQQPRGERTPLLSEDWDIPESCTIVGDRQKLQIVIHNLFDNAVSYSNDGGAVAVSLKEDPQFVLLTISNTGSQVASADAPLLFKRFWRGDAARSGTGSHCGLGLSLCQRLMDLLGGSIGVESESGGVFTARVSIPRGEPARVSRPEAAYATALSSPWK